MIALGTAFGRSPRGCSAPPGANAATRRETIANEHQGARVRPMVSAPGKSRVTCEPAPRPDADDQRSTDHPIGRLRRSSQPRNRLRRRVRGRPPGIIAAIAPSVLSGRAVPFDPSGESVLRRGRDPNAGSFGGFLEPFKQVGRNGDVQF